MAKGSPSPRPRSPSSAGPCNATPVVLAGFGEMQTETPGNTTNLLNQTNIRQMILAGEGLRSSSAWTAGRCTRGSRQSPNPSIHSVERSTARWTIQRASVDLARRRNSAPRSSSLEHLTSPVTGQRRRAQYGRICSPNRREPRGDALTGSGSTAEGAVPVAISEADQQPCPFLLQLVDRCVDLRLEKSLMGTPCTIVTWEPSDRVGNEQIRPFRCHSCRPSIGRRCANLRPGSR